MPPKELSAAITIAARYPVKVNALGEVSPLVLVDNNRIGELFPDVTLARFWPKANQFLADLWDAFNRLSVRDSEFYSALDGTDYLRLLSPGKCTAPGYAEVEDLKSPVGLTRAMSEAVHGGLLANGFDLSTASAVGAIIVGSANTLRHLPAAYLDNGLRVVGEIMHGGYAFSEVYADSSVHAKLKLYVLFGGLDLPLERVEELARDTRGEYEVLQEKLQASNPQSPISSLQFLEGGLRLERGGGNGDVGLHPLPQALFDLISGDVESRVQAAVVLGELGDARAAGLLQRALRSEKEDHVRTAVMQSLRTLGVDPIPVLIQQLEGQRSDNAAEALIQVGKDAVESLLQDLESTESSTARWQILQTLGKIGDTQAVPAKIKALGSHGYAKAKAAEAFGVFGDPRATLPLVELLEETSIHPTREAVIQALIQLNDEQAIELLAGLFESPKREYAIQVLQRMGEAGIRALIQTCENTKDRATRKVIGEALGDRKPKRGLFR